VVCSSGIGFDPVVNGTRLTFGFEGIYQGTAVLYDHQTESLWMHLTGACFAGTHAGTVLARIQSGRHTTWADWRALYPDTDVLAQEARWMDQPGDRGYFPREGLQSGDPYLPRTFTETIETVDARLEAHDLLYGVVIAGSQRAYPFKRLEEARVVQERVGGVEVTVWFDARSRSAAAFDRRLGGTTHAFVRDEAGVLRDRGTQSRWTMDGTCVEGALKGAQLEPLHGLMSEWYGWYALHPKTSIWGD
jgi:hypothetical protein